jgi:hypothetical protein
MSEFDRMLWRDLLRWHLAKDLLWGRIRGIFKNAEQPLFDEMCELQTLSTNVAGRIANRFPSLPVDQIVALAGSLVEIARVLRRDRASSRDHETVDDFDRWHQYDDSDLWALSDLAGVQIDAACGAFQAEVRPGKNGGSGGRTRLPLTEDEKAAKRAIEANPGLSLKAIKEKARLKLNVKDLGKLKERLRGQERRPSKRPVKGL